MTKMRLLNMAGKQRLLSQELIKLILMKKFHVGHTETINTEISDLSGKFEKSLGKLWKSKHTSEIIRKQLQTVIFKWRCFIDSTKEKEIEDVLEKNGELLIAMDKAVSMYERS